MELSVDKMMVIDFEALRGKLWRKKFFEALPPKFFDLLFKADAVLVMGGEKRSGTSELDAAE